MEGKRRGWGGGGKRGNVDRKGILNETEKNCDDHNGKGSDNGMNMGTLH